MSLFSVFLVHIQSHCGKIQTKKTPNTDTFYAVFITPEIIRKPHSAILDLCKLLTPAPTAVNERLFSALKSLKTYIRSTTDDTHFENVIVLHIHRDFTDKLKLKNIATILFKALNLVKNVS